MSSRVAPLGRVLVLTDRGASPRPLVRTVERAVLAGARAVVLREKDLSRAERRALAVELLSVLGPAALIVASDAGLARELGAGVHLASGERGEASVVGVSCHTAADVAEAAWRGATYVTLSPVFPSPSKPGYGPPIGPEALGGHPVPVYALGGLAPGLAARCVLAGAAGVATMGECMRDPEAVGRMLEEIAAATGA